MAEKLENEPKTLFLGNFRLIFLFSAIFCLFWGRPKPKFLFLNSYLFPISGRRPENPVVAGGQGCNTPPCSCDSSVGDRYDWTTGGPYDGNDWIRRVASTPDKTGRKPEMGKNWPKNRKWPSARNGEKMAQKWRKNGMWGHCSIFSRHFWAIFSPFRAEGHFLFSGQFFPISGFRPVFHSTPGGLTRNP